ncbi:MAG: hypothetical protein IPM63_00060 [Acidobacteriota bacterium]|nr:MAG: hypothetical protein IPM63_00060 [Acidobacteriota bacterium]
MTYYRDKSKRCMTASGPHVRAIGWLDKKHRFRKGRTSLEFREKLRKFSESASSSTFSLGWGVFFGHHTCELCEKFSSGLNFGVPAGEILYVAPEMVSHYVENHRYRPPKEFVKAVLDSPLPDTREYSDAIARFRRPDDQPAGYGTEGYDPAQAGDSSQVTSARTEANGVWNKILRILSRS